MKKEDTKIQYRPELADKLESCMKDAIKLYKKETKKVYYRILSLLCEKKEDLEGKELFLNASYFFDKKSSIGDEHYGTSLEHNAIKFKYGEKIADITSASAARLVFAFYKEDIEKSFDTIDISGFSKQEKYMVEHFKHIVLSPTRNPNFQIKEGNTKCYYDSIPGGDIEFAKDIKRSIEFIEKESKWMLEIFRTPDIEKTENQEIDNPINELEK